MTGAQTLDQLWEQARQFGRIHIHTHPDGTVSASIEFACIPGIYLTAKSRFDHATPQDALALAIEKAQEIVAAAAQRGTQELITGKKP